MIRLAPAALMLCVSACSSEPQRNTVDPAAVPTAAPTAARPTPVSAPIDAEAKPAPGELKTFGDWAVGCDNTQRCELRSLAPDLEPPGGVTVAIARDAGPTGAVSLTIGDNDSDDFTGSVDGQAAATPAALVAAMANGKLLAARNAGRVVANLSLKGASAALRYVDAVQGRVGTVTALVAKGAKPASAVPAAAAPPVIVAVAATGTAAKPTAQQVAAMRRAAACDPERATDDGLGAPEMHALGGGRTLVLLPCSAGAYNLLQAVFVLDTSGFAPVVADAPVGFAETGADSPKVPTVINGEVQGGVLTSYAKGRGLGDCGVTQDFVWDGKRLRLSGQREMGECRGNSNYITTWRTDVVRR